MKQSSRHKRVCQKNAYLNGDGDSWRVKQEQWLSRPAREAGGGRESSSLDSQASRGGGARVPGGVGAGQLRCRPHAGVHVGAERIPQRHATIFRNDYYCLFIV